MTRTGKSVIAVSVPKQPKYTTTNLKFKQNTHTNSYIQIWFDQLVQLVLRERYFFTFTDNYTRMLETYMGTRKSNWLKYLKRYDSLYRTFPKKNSLSNASNQITALNYKVKKLTSRCKRKE